MVSGGSPTPFAAPAMRFYQAVCNASDGTKDRSNQSRTRTSVGSGAASPPCRAFLDPMASPADRHRYFVREYL